MKYTLLLGLLFISSCQQKETSTTKADEAPLEVIRVEEDTETEAGADTTTTTDTEVTVDPVVEVPVVINSGLKRYTIEKKCTPSTSLKSKSNFVYENSTGYYVSSVDERLQVLKTIDLGKTWTTLFQSPAASVVVVCNRLSPKSVQLINPKTLLISGNRACPGGAREWVVYSLDTETGKISTLNSFKMGGSASNLSGPYTHFQASNNMLIVGGNYVPPTASTSLPILRRSHDGGKTWINEFFDVNLTSAVVMNYAKNSNLDEVVLVTGKYAGLDYIKGFQKLNKAQFWKEIFEVKSSMMYGNLDLSYSNDGTVYFVSSQYPTGSFLGSWKNSKLTVTSETPKTTRPRYYRSVHEQNGLVDILSFEVSGTGYVQFLSYLNQIKETSETVQRKPGSVSFGSQYYADATNNLFVLFPDGQIELKKACN